MLRSLMIESASSERFRRVVTLNWTEALNMEMEVAAIKKKMPTVSISRRLIGALVHVGSISIQCFFIVASFCLCVLDAK